MRRRARTDANHQLIRARFRAYGWYVVDSSRMGDGFPDLICMKQGRVLFVEVKDGSKPPSRQALTDDERRVHEMFAACRVPITIVTDVSQVTL